MSRSPRAATWIHVSAAAAVLAAAVLYPFEPCLTLRSGDGKLLAAFSLRRGQPRFELSYLHSVARLPAIEYFRIADGELELYRTAYQGLGAGLPFGEEGGVVRLEGGWILLEGLERRFRQITLSPMPLTENRLRIGGREIDLATLSGGRALTLRLERRSLSGRLVFGRRMGYIKP